MLELSHFTEISRVFQYDYIYIDAVFLIGWLALLVYHKKWPALAFGIVIAPIIYFIDAGIWWNTLLESGNYIREYWISGIQLSHPLNSYALQKFGADFMMTISYSLFTFPWLWIMFENFYQKNRREILTFTIYYFGAWMIVPFLSLLVNIDNSLVETVRHMGGQIDFWIFNAVMAYVLLFVVYGTNLFGSKNPKKILCVFVVSFLGSLIMELPLYASGIRQTGLVFVLFEGLILLNQGVPYLFLVYDKVIPFVKRKIPNLLD
jgi:hypothetical protein